MRNKLLSEKTMNEYEMMSNNAAIAASLPPIHIHPPDLPAHLHLANLPVVRDKLNLKPIITKKVV